MRVTARHVVVGQSARRPLRSDLSQPGVSDTEAAGSEGGNSGRYDCVTDSIRCVFRLRPKCHPQAVDSSTRVNGFQIRG